jgi:hypothetical protein
MVRSNRTRRSTIALALTVWSQGCAVQRPVSNDVSPLQGARLRVRSTQPLLLNESDGQIVKTPFCRAIALEGTVRRVMGDTLILERVGSVYNAPDSDGVRRGCLRRDVVAFVRTSDLTLTERRTDKGRTTLLLVAIAAGLIGIAAYGASQIEYDWPTGTGTFGFAAVLNHR